MRGEDYDDTFHRLRNWANLEDEDPVEYCKRVLGLQRNLDLYTSLYKDKIKRIRDEIAEGKIANETLEIVDEIYHDINNALWVEFFKIEDKRQKIVKKLIRKYRNRAMTLNLIHQSLQIILITGSAIVPFIIVSDIPKTIPFITSAIVAVAAALTKYYPFGEHIINFRIAFEKTQKEYDLYESERGPYADLGRGAALDLVLDHIDEIRHEQNELSLSLEKRIQDQSKELEKVAQEQISKLKKTD